MVTMKASLGSLRSVSIVTRPEGKSRFMVAELSGVFYWGSPMVDPSVTENISDLFAFFTNLFCIFFFIVLYCWQIAAHQTRFVHVHFPAYFTQSSITFSLHSLRYKLGNMGKAWLKITRIRWFLLQTPLVYRFFLNAHRTKR